MTQKHTPVLDLEPNLQKNALCQNHVHFIWYVLEFDTHCVADAELL